MSKQLATAWVRLILAIFSKVRHNRDCPHSTDRIFPTPAGHPSSHPFVQHYASYAHTEQQSNNLNRDLTFGGYV